MSPSVMASKLAVAGLIEGYFSEEGLAAMSDVRDMTSQMAKELAQGIKDNVEDIVQFHRFTRQLLQHGGQQLCVDRQRILLLRGTADLLLQGRLHIWVFAASTDSKAERPLLKCVNLMFTRDGLKRAAAGWRFRRSCCRRWQ